MQEYYWMALSFAVGSLSTLYLSKKKKSLVFYALLLAALFILFGPAGTAGGIAALAYRYKQK